MARRLATIENGVMDPFRVAICLDVFEEMGIVRREAGGIIVNKIDGKINLNQSKILQSLRRGAEKERRPGMEELNSNHGPAPSLSASPPLRRMRLADCSSPI